MRHIFTALVTAIEAAVIALAGIAVVAVPTMLVGLVTLSLSVDPLLLAQIVAAIWALGHGVQMGFTLDAQSALGLGLEAATIDVNISLIPLTLSLFTVWLAWRVGRRFSADFATGCAALLGGTLGFTAAAMLTIWAAGSLSSGHPLSSGLTAALWFVAPSWVGFLTRHGDRVSHMWFRFKVRLEQAGSPKLGWAFEPYLARTLRMCAALIASVGFLGALAFTVALAVAYVDVVSLTQALQLDTIGVLTFFAGQLAFLPTLILWSLAWMSGAGFSLGIGSSVSPSEVLIGPLPSVPVFAAIPEALGDFAFIPLVLVGCTGLVVGLLFGGLPEYQRPKLWRTMVVALVALLLSGLCVAFALFLSCGSLGPGRLSTVGPEVWQSTGLIVGALAVGLFSGLVLRRGSEETSGTAPGVPEHQRFTILSLDEGGAAARDGAADGAETVNLDELLDPQDDGEKVRLHSPAPKESAVDDTGSSGVAPYGSQHDLHVTQQVKRASILSRIADPALDLAQPLFRAKPRKRRTEPTFDEEQLIENFSWEAREKEDDL